jgi:hypothetical protein
MSDKKVSKHLKKPLVSEEVIKLEKPKTKKNKKIEVIEIISGSESEGTTTSESTNEKEEIKVEVKPKKERTEAQKAAFLKVKAKREEMNRIKKEEKEKEANELKDLHPSQQKSYHCHFLKFHHNNPHWQASEEAFIFKIKKHKYVIYLENSLHEKALEMCR